MDQHNKPILIPLLKRIITLIRHLEVTETLILTGSNTVFTGETRTNLGPQWCCTFQISLKRVFKWHTLLKMDLIEALKRGHSYIYLHATSQDIRVHEFVKPIIAVESKRIDSASSTHEKHNLNRTAFISHPFRNLQLFNELNNLFLNSFFKLNFITVIKYKIPRL